MTVTVPGNAPLQNKTPQAKKVKVEFPKCVYGKSLDDMVVINSEDERPDGYVDYKVFMGTDAKEDAKAKKAESKKAEKAYRQGIMEYLDEHDVDYAKNLSTPKLEELKVALDEHLGQQDPQDDA